MKIIQIIDYKTFGEDYLDIAEKTSDKSDILWFRIKGEDGSFIYNKAKKLRELLSEKPLILSERADIADMLGYQAVQLGAYTLDVDSVRKAYPNLKIGYSSHNFDEIRNIDADYFTLSPLFYTVKDYHVNPLGAVDVSAYNKEIYGLGGISSENVSELKNKGYAGVAGISFYKFLERLNNKII
jgi:thiamine-phosphate pyrophosphorylase